MRQWLSEFEAAMQADMQQREQAEQRQWMFKILGILVTAAVALAAQLALFT